MRREVGTEVSWEVEGPITTDRAADIRGRSADGGSVLGLGYLHKHPDDDTLGMRQRQPLVDG